MTTLRTIALAFAPWCAGLLVGYLLITLPVVGAALLLCLVGYIGWRAIASRKQRVRLPAAFLLVWLLLIVSALLGVSSGFGLASHGSNNPWMGLLAAGLAWVVAQLARTTSEG